jgi:hypothetical protein
LAATTAPEQFSNKFIEFGTLQVEAGERPPLVKMLAKANLIKGSDDAI